MRIYSYSLKRCLLSSLFVFAVTFCLTGVASAYVIGPTTPGKWGAPFPTTPGGTVTWSFMADGAAIDEGAGEFNGFNSALSTFMPVGFEAAINAAFDAWSAVADIQFLEVVDTGEDFGLPGAAEIRLGGHIFDGPSGTLAHGFYPPINGFTEAGDIHFDVVENWVIGQGLGGFDVFTVAAHEIGHAIGLDHTGVAGSLMNPFYTEDFYGLQADDIAGAQFLYGAAVTAVPEPSTVMLLSMGIVGMLGYGWKRRKKNQEVC